MKTKPTPANQPACRITAVNPTTDFEFTSPGFADTKLDHAELLKLVCALINDCRCMFVAVFQDRRDNRSLIELAEAILYAAGEQFIGLAKHRVDHGNAFDMMLQILLAIWNAREDIFKTKDYAAAQRLGLTEIRLKILELLAIAETVLFNQGFDIRGKHDLPIQSVSDPENPTKFQELAIFARVADLRSRIDALKSRDEAAAIARDRAGQGRAPIIVYATA